MICLEVNFFLIYIVSLTDNHLTFALFTHDLKSTQASQNQLKTKISYIFYDFSS